MAFLRKENKTADEDIPYLSYSNASLYIHGSTYTTDWRTNLISAISDSNVLLLDPWKNSWNSYVNALKNELEEFQNLASSVISSGEGGVGTGIVSGYTPLTIPNISNMPYFWEKRNSDACAFHFFCFDSNEEVANHVILQLSAAINAHPNKTVVHIPNADWRINYSIFLKNLPKENYFGKFENAVDRIKDIMGL